MRDPIGPLDPPVRLLCGPGPANVADAVQAAMQRPLLGHLDPYLQELMAELVDMLGRLFGRSDGITLPLSATGTAGMELGIASLLERGDKVVVAVNGYFGRRIVDMAHRQRADVVRVDAEWGATVSNDELLSVVDANPDTRLVAVVHAETSTGVAHPLRELGEAMRERAPLLMADTVTSLGGIPLEAQAWGIDYCYSCTQKCLAAPPGMAPVTVSPAGLARIYERTTALPFYLDVNLLADYWLRRPAAYHHTAPVLMIYALHEAARLALEEGLEARWERHAVAGRRLQDGLRARGLELLADPECQLPQLTAVRVPEGLDNRTIQSRLLNEHGIEIGGGLGPTAPDVWRIGLMGHNATVEVADRVLAGLDAVLGGRG